MLGDILDITDEVKQAGMYVCLYVYMYVQMLGDIFQTSLMRSSRLVCMHVYMYVQMLGDILDITDEVMPAGMYVCMYVCIDAWRHFRHH